LALSESLVKSYHGNFATVLRFESENEAETLQDADAERRLKG